MPGDRLTFLVTAKGTPFSGPSFGNWFGDACSAAGLKDRSAHGLRKTAAIALAEAGCTTKQIQSITGHRTIREIERYTRGVAQAELAKDAIHILIARERRKNGDVSN